MITNGLRVLIGPADIGVSVLSESRCNEPSIMHEASDFDELISMI